MTPLLMVLAALTFLSAETSPGDTVTRVTPSCGSELVFEIHTGTLDLPGGTDNLDVIITYYDRPAQRVENVNRSRRWDAGTTQRFLVLVEGRLGPSEIAGIELSASPSVGQWEVDQLVVVARGEGLSEEVYRASGAPLFRLTGEGNGFAAEFN